MYWALKATEKLCKEIEKNRSAINDLTIELRKVEAKTEVLLVHKPFEGLANEHTVRVSMSAVVKLLMGHLGLQIRHIREGYTLEEVK